jgi:ABC-type Fe3+ transport system permease subunit
MSDHIRCTCRRCTIRSLMGPAIIITVGVLFLLDQMRGGYFSFNNTFPIILIVIGVIQLAAALSSTEGHIDAIPPAAPSTTPPPQYPFPGQGQGR